MVWIFLTHNKCRKDDGSPLLSSHWSSLLLSFLQNFGTWISVLSLILKPWKKISQILKNNALFVVLSWPEKSRYFAEGAKFNDALKSPVILTICSWNKTENTPIPMDSLGHLKKILNNFGLFGTILDHFKHSNILENFLQKNILINFGLFGTILDHFRYSNILENFLQKKLKN